MTQDASSIPIKPLEEAQQTVRRRIGPGAILAAIFVVALLVLVGMGLVRTQQGRVGIGSQGPEFTLTTFDGQNIRSEDLRGQVVVINFWASWCKPCEQEAAELELASRQFADQSVVFLGVNYVDTEPEALAYLQRFDITYPNGPDLGTRISQAYRIRGVPETFILDPSGGVVQVKIGPFLSLDEIVASVQAAQQP